MNHLTIPTDLLSAGTPLAVMLYAAMNVYAKYAVTERETIAMPAKKLLWDVYGYGASASAAKTAKLLEGIAELEGRGVVEYDPKTKSVLIRREAMWPEQYVAIRAGEFDAIQGQRGGYHQWLMFHYFCHAVRSLDAFITVGGRNRVVGHMPQKYFADLLDVTPATIQKYNAKLEELKLLYVVRNAYKSNNCYCRYDDRNLLKEYLT